MAVNSLRILLCEEAARHEVGHLWQPEEFLLESEVPGKTAEWAENWEQTAPTLSYDFVGVLLSKWREVARLESLEREVLLLKDRVAELERSTPVCVPIETFAPEPYKVVKPFHVVVQTRADEYVASFFDANLSASGPTETEAIFNLKDVILGVLESLTEHDKAELGPGPAKQLRVLKKFVEKTA